MLCLDPRVRDAQCLQRRVNIHIVAQEHQDQQERAIRKKEQRCKENQQRLREQTFEQARLLGALGDQKLAKAQVRLDGIEDAREYKQWCVQHEAQVRCEKAFARVKRLQARRRLHSAVRREEHKIKEESAAEVVAGLDRERLEKAEEVLRRLERFDASALKAKQQIWLDQAERMVDRDELQRLAHAKRELKERQEELFLQGVEEELAEKATRSWPLERELAKKKLIVQQRRKEMLTEAHALEPLLEKALYTGNFQTLRKEMDHMAARCSSAPSLRRLRPQSAPCATRES